MAYGFDEDGHLDFFFKDKLENGLNCNEEYYNSSSKYYNDLPKEVSKPFFTTQEECIKNLN